MSIRSFIRNWPPRHQHPLNRVLHAIGIPLTVLALPLIAWQLYQSDWPNWWRPVALIVVGYGLQYVGHKIEGNDMGELLGIKKRLGKPYVEIAPQYAQADE